jgi:UDP-N-acetylmuramyl pentapeptide phosphotransferase/UDP-N-acetylglucosamine-1-phosphate transferase
MKDDLMGMSAWKKLAAEFVALLILVFIGDMRLSSMQGMFNIGELSYPVSVLLSIFAGIVIINAFNLIDGIDGLAASIAMLVTFIFGSYFVAVGDYEYAILASTILGAIFPFYLYNAFGHVNKIFMGDTGSLILGFAMTILVFRFNEINAMPDVKFHFGAAPSFSFAVLMLPMFDTIRVFVVRIYRGLSPFKADNRHIHHVLLDLGLTHFQSTLLLVSINLVFIAFAYFFNYLGNSVLIGIMILFASILSMYAMRLRLRKSAMQQLKHAVK